MEIFSKQSTSRSNPTSEKMLNDTHKNSLKAIKAGMIKQENDKIKYINEHE